MAVSDYSTTAADNTSISGLTVSDSTVADTLDNIIRQLMADIKAADDANAKYGDTETITGSWTFNTINVDGGTIDAVTLGGSSPVTSVKSSGAIEVEGSTPIIRLDETDGTSAYRQSWIVQSSDAFSVRTYDSTDTFVSIDYQIDKDASGATDHSFRVAGTERLAVSSSGVDVTGAAVVSSTVTCVGLTTAGDIYTLGVGTEDIGQAAAFRFRTIYLVNTPNVSSDARLKKDIAQLADAEIRVGQILKGLIRTYRLKEGDDRKRVGVIAQEVIEAFEAEGLDWRDYNIVTGSAEDGYGVSYDELLALVIGAL